MASETLTVPEERLAEVIAVLRAGLKTVKVSSATKRSLLKWCQEEEKYLSSTGDESE